MRRPLKYGAAIVLLALVGFAAKAAVSSYQEWTDNQSGAGFDLFNVGHVSVNNLADGGFVAALPSTGQLVIGTPSSLFTPDAPLVFGGVGGTHLQLTQDGTSIGTSGGALQRLALTMSGAMTGTFAAGSATATTAFGMQPGNSFFGVTGSSSAIPAPISCGTPGNFAGNVAGTLACGLVPYSSLSGAPTLHYQTVLGLPQEPALDVGTASATGLSASDNSGVSTRLFNTLITGLSGGQIAIGGTGAGDNLTLLPNNLAQTPSNVGRIYLGNSGTSFIQPDVVSNFGSIITLNNYVSLYGGLTGSGDAAGLHIGSPGGPANSAPVDVEVSSNSYQSISIVNPNTGSNASAAIQVGQTISGVSGRLQIFGSGYTPSGLMVPGNVMLASVGASAGGPNLVINSGSNATTGDLILATGDLEHWRITFSGSLQGVERAMPTTPASTFQKIWPDSVIHNIMSINSSGIVTHMIQSNAGTAHEWVSAIADNGSVTLTQPAFTDVSGQATLAQLPSIASNSFLMNAMGSSAVPSAVSPGTTSGVMEYVHGSPDTLAAFPAGSTRVPFGSGTNGQLTDSSTFAFNSTSNLLSIGLATPDVGLHVKNTTTPLSKLYVENTASGSSDYVELGLVNNLGLGQRASWYMGSSTSNFSSLGASAMLLENAGGAMAFQGAGALSVGLIITKNATNVPGDIQIPRLSAGGMTKSIVTTGQLAVATAGADYSAGTASLATGPLCNTTGTGALTACVAGTNISFSGTTINATGGGGGTVTSVTGTSGQILCTPTSPNPVCSLVATGPGVTSCTNCSATIDTLGRVTALSSGTAPVTSVIGTAQRISVTSGATPVVDTIGAFYSGAVSGGNQDLGTTLTNGLVCNTTVASVASMHTCSAGTDYQAPIAGNTCGSNTFATSINTAGTISCSGLVCGGLPALTGDTHSSAGTCATVTDHITESSGPTSLAIGAIPASTPDVSVLIRPAGGGATIVGIDSNAMSVADKFAWFMNTTLTIGGGFIATSDSSNQYSATIEYPTTHKVQSITLTVNLIANGIVTGTPLLNTTRNGSGIGGGSAINFSSSTTPGVYTTTFASGSSSSSDLYGLQMSNSATGTLEFTATLVLN